MADCVTDVDIADEPLDLSVHKSKCEQEEDNDERVSPKLKRRTIVDSPSPYPQQWNGEQSLQMAANNFSTVLQYYLTAARLWQSEVIQCNESRPASSNEMAASDEIMVAAAEASPESAPLPPVRQSKSSKRRNKEQESPAADGSNRPRKTRTTFTGKQLFELERIFEQKKYLSSNERQEVARLLNVTGSQVIKHFYYYLF